MNKLRFPIFLFALLAAVLVLSPVRARAAVSFDFFYDNLAPYGEWIQVGDYGMCWRPTNVDQDWAPYSDGYWAYTDAGWTWVSYEEFGPIVYHYGRWTRLEDEGWCWVPESEWAPAWVSWRSSDDYVGWAPLPPEARWQRDVGISVWADSVYHIGPGYYNFCRVRDFGAPVLRGVILDRRENFGIILRTENVTNITYHAESSSGPVIFNGGPNFGVVNRSSSRPIPTLKLVTNLNPDPAGWREHRGPKGLNPIAARTVGNQLFVAAPEVSGPADAAAFRSQAKRVISADKVTKGWGGMKDRNAQDELRRELQRQSKGLTPQSAPARPVAAGDLKFLPEKGDPRATSNATSPFEKSGKGKHPETKVGEPNNTPPNNPLAPSSTGNLKPFNPSSEPGAKTKGQSPLAPTSQDPQSDDEKRRELFRQQLGGDQSKSHPGQEHAPQKPSENPFPQKNGPPQDAAKPDDAHRREPESQQQQQLQQFQQKLQHPPEPKRDPEAEREHGKSDNQRPPSPFPPQQQQQQQQQQQPQQHGNQPPGSPQPQGAHHSKDGKDKDKDKDKDKNNGN